MLGREKELQYFKDEKKVAVSQAITFKFLLVKLRGLKNMSKFDTEWALLCSMLVYDVLNSGGSINALGKPMEVTGNSQKSSKLEQQAWIYKKISFRKHFQN